MNLERALATPGWMSECELEYLAHLSYSLPPKSIIAEIGSFKGRSTNALALNPDIVVFCVDPWTKYGFGDFTNCYDEFTRNTAHLHNIVIYREYSVIVAGYFHKASMGAVFIDGDHTADHVRADILNWCPLLKPGGILCGHDYGHGDWPDVKTVVDELIPNRLIVEGTSIWTTEGT